MSIIEKLKISDGSAKRIGALALAGSMFAGMCGCGNSEEPKETVKVPVSSTIDGTLNVVNHLTKMDEFLATAETTQGYKMDELVEMYNIARSEKDLNACNDYLYSIGRLLIMAQVAEQVGVSFEDIEDFSIGDETITIAYKVEWKENVSGGIEVFHTEIKTKTFELKGEIRDTVRNMDNADKRLLEFHSDNYRDVDKVYSSYIKKALLSTSEVVIDKPGFWGTLFGEQTTCCIDNQLDPEKIDAFNEYNNETRSSSSNYSYNCSGEDRGISLCEAIREQKQEQSLDMAAKALGQYHAKRLHR